ncbi:MAG: tetratricopeptide repeat protein [Rhodospirillales bacterium]
MKKHFIARAILALAAAGLIFPQQGQPAQTQAAPAGGSPVAKQPSVKSQAEGEALQAIFQTTDANSRIKAADEFVVKFADSEFKPFVLMVAAETYRQMNNYENTVIYGERVLEADPQNYMAMLLLASTIAQRTREHDLDREEKLGRVEKYVKTALDLIEKAPRPRPDVTDDQWNQAKADFKAQAHEAMGMAAIARKNYPAAITELKTAIEMSPTPDPATQVRLGAVYNLAGQYDNAIATLNQVMATPDLHPQIRQIAQAERARAMQAKGVTAAPQAPAAAPAPAAPQAAPAPAAPEPKL